MKRQRIDLMLLFRETFAEWNSHNGPRLAAALAYYTIFSMAPVIVIAIAVAGLVFGERAASGELLRQVQTLIGPDGARSVETVIQNARVPGSGAAAILGLLILVFGASGVFGQLQGALNTIWGVVPIPAQPGRTHREIVLDFIKKRLLSFLMVLGTGFLLLVSLVVSALLAILGSVIDSLLPGFHFLSESLNFIISLGAITLLLAMIYKVLPDVPVAWHDVSLGAALTALLFTLGKSLIGLYLGSSGITSMYGAAGSLIVILFWVYYSAQVLFLGAEFTQVYARRYGSHAPRIPTEGFKPVSHRSRRRKKAAHTEKAADG